MKGAEATQEARANRFIAVSLVIELKHRVFKYDARYVEGPAFFDIPILRVYLHEFVHLWQLFGQRYLADQAVKVWDDIVAFEQTGSLPPAAPAEAEDGFSAQDLTEAHARFWDMHIIGMEKLREWEMADGSILEREFTTELIHDPASLPGGVTEQQAFDWFVKSGDSYAKPYRLAVERWGTHRTVILFPLVTHFALQSTNPMRLFRNAVDKLERTKIKYDGFIHDGWRVYYSEIRRICIELAINATGEGLQSGQGVLRGSELGSTLLFQHYLQLLQKCAADFWVSDPDYVFAALGDPQMRGLLLGVLQPSTTLFTDGRWPREQTAAEQALRSDSIISPADAIGEAGLDMNERYRRFQNAAFLASHCANRDIAGQGA